MRVFFKRLFCLHLNYVEMYAFNLTYTKYKCAHDDNDAIGFDADFGDN
jgi:hypothetical protein